ncbi:MAG: rhodanese-related sulfurtransferase [Myxococcota bacterium]
MVPLEEVSVAHVGAIAVADRVLIDVRTPSEFATGHAPGAVNAPLSSLQDGLAQIPADAELYIICQSGGRSTRATALLASNGIAAHNVTGGMSAWLTAGLPVE